VSTSTVLEFELGGDLLWAVLGIAAGTVISITPLELAPLIAPLAFLLLPLRAIFSRTTRTAHLL
jgi:hypothetical protein